MLNDFDFRMIGIKVIVFLVSIAIIECTIHRFLKCPEMDSSFCKCYEMVWDGIIKNGGLYNESICKGQSPTTFVSKIADLRLIDTRIPIPPGLPTSIVRLKIQHWNLMMSPDDYANIPTSVKYLYLSNNRISKFNLTYLHHVRNLRILDLSNNPLTTLDIPSSSPFRLQDLYLDGLEWKTLDTTKYELSRLGNLYARNGKIENVKLNFKSGDLNKDIYLENNRITTFDATKFIFNKIDTLDLSENPIQKLDFSSGVDNLRFLYLRNINLKVFDGSMFHLPRLYKLDLSDNPIETVYINGLSIESFTFNNIGLTCFDDLIEGMSNINRLELENNELKTLHLTHYVNSFDVRGNKHISRIKLHSLPKFFDADKESLPCDCCLLKLFSNIRDPSYEVSKCRKSQKHNNNITSLANSIGCDLNRTKTDICDSLPPMPACDGVFKIRPTTPAPPTTTEIEITTPSTQSSGKTRCLSIFFL